jgi:hypothetical protein
MEHFCKLIICFEPRKINGILLELVGRRILRVLLTASPQFDTQACEIFTIPTRAFILLKTALICCSEVPFLGNYSDELKTVCKTRRKGREFFQTSLLCLHRNLTEVSVICCLHLCKLRGMKLLLLGAESFLRSWPVFAASQEIPRIFMEPKSSLPYSQVPANRPYPEPTPSSPHDPLQIGMKLLHNVSSS